MTNCKVCGKEINSINDCYEDGSATIYTNICYRCHPDKEMVEVKETEWYKEIDDNLGSNAVKKYPNLSKGEAIEKYKQDLRDLYKEKDTLYLRCSCNTEVMTIDKEDDEYYICIFDRYNKISFWSKLKMIWKILITGSPYNDEIVLSQKEMDKLKEWMK